MKKENVLRFFSSLLGCIYRATFTKPNLAKNVIFIKITMCDTPSITFAPKHNGTSKYFIDQRGLQVPECTHAGNSYSSTFFMLKLFC